MFLFTAANYTVLEQNVKHSDMIDKYPRDYMIVINGHIEDSEIHGDVVAVLSKEEYAALEKPKNLAPRFSIWKGTALRVEEVNSRLGFFI